MAEDTIPTLRSEIEESRGETREMTLAILDEAQSIFDEAKKRWEDTEWIKREYEEVRLAILEEYFWIQVDREAFKQDIEWYVDGKIDHNLSEGISSNTQALLEIHKSLWELQKASMEVQRSYFQAEWADIENDILNILEFEIEGIDIKQIEDLKDRYITNPELARNKLIEWWIEKDSDIFKNIIEKLEKLKISREKVLEFTTSMSKLKESWISLLDKLLSWTWVSSEELIKVYLKEWEAWVRDKLNEEKEKEDLILEILVELKWYINFETNYQKVQEIKKTKAKEYQEEMESIAIESANKKVSDYRGWVDSLDSCISEDLRDWSYKLTIPWTEKHFEIMPEEKEAIYDIENSDKRAEAIKNLINFRETLLNLNLQFLWNNRNELFRIMQIVNWNPVWFDYLDENMISKNEFKIFLNFILKILWFEKKDDLEDCIAWFRKITWSWLDNDKTDFITWDTMIENIFEAVWYYDWNSQGTNKFKIDKIEDKTSWGKARQIIEWKEEI